MIQHITQSNNQFGTGSVRLFKPRSGQTNNYKIGIFSFSAEHAALQSKSQDWLAQNQDHEFKWSDMYMSARRQLFQ